MIGPGLPSAGTDLPATRVLAEIAQILVPVDAFEDRLRQALRLFGRIVPYDRCALVELQPDGDARIRLVPEPPGHEARTIQEELLALLELVLETGTWQGARRTTTALRRDGPWASYLAMPLVGVDGVGGLLFVGQQTRDGYTERDRRLLSIVAAQVSAYLSIHQLRAQRDRLAAERGGPAQLDLDAVAHAAERASEASRLTRRQLEVARLIAAGRSNAQIAHELVLTPGTVANHIEQILRRLSAKNRAQVAAWVVERGLLNADG